MRQANERRRYKGTSSLIGLSLTQIDPLIVVGGDNKLTGQFIEYME